MRRDITAASTLTWKPRSCVPFKAVTPVPRSDAERFASERYSLTAPARRAGVQPDSVYQQSAVGKSTSAFKAGLPGACLRASAAICQNTPGRKPAFHWTTVVVVHGPLGAVDSGYPAGNAVLCWNCHYCCGTRLDTTAVVCGHKQSLVCMMHSSTMMLGCTGLPDGAAVGSPSPASAAVSAAFAAATGQIGLTKASSDRQSLCDGLACAAPPAATRDDARARRSRDAMYA